MMKLDQNTSSRLLRNLEELDRYFAYYSTRDRRSFQALLELRWLKSCLEAGKMKIPAWQMTLTSGDNLIADPHADACLRELISQLSALRHAREKERRPAVLSSPYAEEFIVSD